MPDVIVHGVHRPKFFSTIFHALRPANVARDGHRSPVLLLALGSDIDHNFDFGAGSSINILD